MTNTTVSDNSTVRDGETIVHVDPRTLLVDTNVRRSTDTDADLTASIRDLGVLVPIVAVRTPQADLRVRFGHRRTAAAIAAGRATVPVLVAADEATDDTAQVERLVSQWAENEHRAGLNTADRVAVIAQLSAFGVPTAKIATRTRAPRAQVEAALSVAGSDLATAAAARYTFLDLIQAAVVAEFEDDTDAVTALVAAAKTGQFDHTAQRLRDARADATRRAQLQAALRDAGTTVVERPTYDATTKHLSDLRSATGDPLDETNHRDCPGHAAYIATRHGWVDPATGDPLDEDPDPYDATDTDTDEADEADAADDTDDEDPGEDDQDTDPSPADDAEPGPPAPQWRSYLAARYVCTNPAAHGHVDRYPGYGTATTRPKIADMSPAEQETARAGRRDVIESNKAWASAETVRRDWLRGFLTRKSVPKGSAAFIATAIATDAETIASTGGNHLAADLLGCQSTGYGRSTTLAALVSQASEPRAHVLTLAQVLAGYEDRTDRSDWRNPRPSVARYLRFIQAQGYTLSPVELRACGEQPDHQPPA